MCQKVLVALLFLIVVLSGCSRPPSEDGPGPVTSGSGPGGGNGADPFAAPANWTVGQWRRFSEMFQNQTGDVTLVVTEATADAYRLSTTSRRQALFDAEEDITYVGLIDRFDLSGKQHNDRVEFFRFPMVANASWDTRWDDVTRTIHALGNVSGVFEFEAIEDGLPAVRYSYDPTSGFFGHIEFLDSGGTVRYSLRLSSYGQNFTGTVTSATVDVLHDFESLASPAGDDTKDVDVVADLSELVLRYGAECPSSGAWSVGFAPAQQDVSDPIQFNDHQQCPTTGERTRVFADPPAGRWEYAAAWASAPKTLDYHALILAVVYAEVAWPLAT